MSNVTVFIHLSVDGFFAGARGEIDWFKEIGKDAEYDRYTNQRSKSGSALIFGRTTYEMMKSYWPTAEAIKNDPEMAKVVNESPKIVFSKTLRKVEEAPNWKNIRLYREIKPQEILSLKQEEDLTILGSGSIVQQFTNLGLIDHYRLIKVPVVLGAGKSLFQEVKKMKLKLVESRSFKNGIVSLDYEPVKS